MRILLVSDYATPTGGAETALFTLQDGLRRYGHEVRMLASSAQPEATRNAADYRCFGTLGRARTLVQACNPTAFFALRRALGDFCPDVVHVGLFLTQLSPLILPVLRRVPTLYQVHWLRPICPIGTKLRPDGQDCPTPPGTICYRAGCIPLRDSVPLALQMTLWRRWSAAFNVIVANSEWTRQRLVAEGVPASTVIWIGVPSRAPRPPLSDPPTVGFAGRLVHEKGVEVLVRAFARVRRQIPHARLVIAGDGPERHRIDATIASFEIEDSVVLLGRQERESLEHHLDAAWVQAVPSLWHEPFGLVAAEAMMRGTAVVASAVGGLAEVVQDKQSGILVPPGDERALAEGLVRILSNRETAEEMGGLGRVFAQRQLSDDVYVRRFIACYDALLQSASLSTRSMR